MMPLDHRTPHGELLALGAFGDHMTMTAISAIAPVSTRPWAAPIDLAEAGRHQHFVSARCTRPWPNDSGRIQAHRPTKHLWRLGA